MSFPNEGSQPAAPPPRSRRPTPEPMAARPDYAAPDNPRPEVVDLAFRLVGHTLPADHGYALYAALSGAVPGLHQGAPVAIHPIGGLQMGHRQMRITAQSRLTIRGPLDRLGGYLALTGRCLKIAGHTVVVGIPSVRLLRPAASLRSRLITIKLPKWIARRDAQAGQYFARAVRHKLTRLGVARQAQITLGRRRTLRIRGKEICGYEVLLQNLTAADSLRLQSQIVSDGPSVFGRRRMGCGIFVPYAPKTNERTPPNLTAALSQRLA